MTPAVRNIILGGSFAAESNALFAAMTVKPPLARKNVINRCIVALRPVWTKIDALWVLAAHDEQAGRLNWKSPGNFTCSNVDQGSGPATFTTDEGFAGNGTNSYIQTGWDPATNGSQLTQDNAHISLYGRTAGSSGDHTFGTQGGYALTAKAGAGTSDLVTVNYQDNSLAGAAGGTLPHFVIGRRNDSANISLMRDGVQSTTAARGPSQALSSVDLTFGRAGSGYEDAQHAMGSVGAYLDDTESLAFYNAMYTYMVAIGADT